MVERLDARMSANDDFVQSAFENSPRQILTIGSTAAYDPLLGYYEPDRVREFDRKAPRHSRIRRSPGRPSATRLPLHLRRSR